MNADDVPALAQLDQGLVADLGTLRAKLVREAELAGILDVAYSVIDTPLGDVLLVATERGLVRVAYSRQDHGAVLEEIAAKVSPRILEVPRRLEVAARQVTEYFEGSRTRFEIPLDLRMASGFRREVLAGLQLLDYGTTRSYAGVAASVGRPRAVRAVGTACALNPLPIVVPCHRVVRSDGTPGEYVGGPAAKRRLLELEGVS